MAIMALGIGATTAAFSVADFVLLRALPFPDAGVTIGLALAYIAGRSLQSLLVGVRPFDVVTFSIVAGLTLVMAGAGTLLPALRAQRIDPLRAIRGE